MNIKAISYTVLLSFLTLSLRGADTTATVIDFSNGKLPPSSCLKYWPTQGCRLSVSNFVQTPDRKKTMEVVINKGRSGQGIGSRQIFFRCLNNLYHGQQVRISFPVKSNSDMKLRVSCTQLQSPFASPGKEGFKDFSVTEKWQTLEWKFKVQNNLQDKYIAIPRLMFGNAPAGIKFWIGPVTIQSINETVLVNLRKVANMGFADETAEDGKGGWSDQGANNDFRDFNIQQKIFCDIPVHIINPVENKGKSVISFYSSQFPSGPKTVCLKLKSNIKRKYLYILHSLCWAPLKGKEIGKITMSSAGREGKIYPVISGIDLNDWWNPQTAANAVIAFEKNNRGMYLSRFPLPDSGVDEIQLNTENNGLWIIAGISLSDQTAKNVTQKTVEINSNKKWRPVDTSNLNVEKGSALDLYDLNDHHPVGTYGRIIVNKNNRLAFEKKPENAIRFRCAAVQPILDLSRLTKDQIPLFAEMISRQGYNLVRIAGADGWLMKQDKAPWKEVKLEIPEQEKDIHFAPERLDKLDFFISELKKRGIYIYMEGMASFVGYVANANLWVYGPHHPQTAIAHLFGENCWRNNWTAGVSKLLTHINPYTGIALRDDPVLAVFLFTNEQDLLPGHIKSTARILYPAWKEFLKKKYKAFPALSQAWNGKYGNHTLNSKQKLSGIPELEANVSFGNSRAGIDTTLFFAAAEKEMTEFYRRQIATIGYKGLTSLWDFCPRLLEIPGRCLNPVVSMHNYHAHPSRYTSPGSQINQSSALKSGGNGFKQFGPTRLLNRPFMIMEYGIVFWNRFRHEQGLLFGAGAALQNYDAINLHCAPARLSDKGEQLRPFNNTGLDPINRASEVVAAFAYKRGDVAAARHVIAFSIDNKYIFSGRAMHGFNDELSQLWAVSKIGLRYKNDSRPQASSDIILHAGKTSKLKYQVGATGTEYTTDDVGTLSAAVSALRKAGIINNKNLSDPENNILQSDTGEITLDIKNGTLTVITPRLEGITVKQNKPLQLGAVRIEKCSVPAAVSVISLDKNAAIDKSKHLLVVFATDALNSAMKFASSDHSKLLSIGELPVLVQTGRLRLTVKRKDSGEKVDVFALKLNGQKLCKIASHIDNNKLYLDINTATISTEPALFYEVKFH